MSDTLDFWNTVFDKYAERGPHLSNAMDLAPYKERFFWTRNSLYHIDSEGKVIGRPDVDDARIALIGGIDPIIYSEVYHGRGWCSRPPGDISTEEVVDLIVNHGRVAREGDVLALVIDPRDVRYGKTPWLLTSNIRKIIETSELPVC